MTLSRGPGRGAEGVRPSSTRAASVRGASTSGVPESLQPPSGSIVASREQLPDQGVDQEDSAGGGDVTPGARTSAASLAVRGETPQGRPTVTSSTQRYWVWDPPGM